MQGSDAVTVCFFGEGAMAEGEFHEAMNLAALWDAPVLFCCENNLYAMGTSLETSEAETNLAVKAAAYEMPAWTVDGMDVLAVRDATDRALTAIRGSGGPVFLELQTYRFRAHSMFDPDLYRDRAEIEQWRAARPDPCLCIGPGARPACSARTTARRWNGRPKAEIDDAVAFADASGLEPVEDLGVAVYRREVAE